MHTRILLASLLAIASPAPAREWTLDLAGEWKFQAGDDPRWAAPDFDDSRWSTVTVPQPLRQSGYGWYRTVVLIPGEAGARSILFGLVSDAYELYANGVRIGGAGQMGLAKGQSQDGHLWTLPAANTVTLAVRVWMTPTAGGIMGGVLAGPPDTIRRMIAGRRAARNLPYVIFSVIDLMAALFVLMLFLADRSRREYLWFACWETPWPLAVLVYILVLDVWFPPALVHLLFALTLAVGLEFVWSFLGRPMGPRPRILQLLLFLFWPLAAMGYSGVPLGLTFLVAGFVSVWVLARGVNRRRPGEIVFASAFAITTLLNAIPASVPLIPGLPEFLLFSVNIKGVGYPLNMLASFVTPALLVFLLMQRFQRTSREESRLRGELESARAMQSLMASAPQVPGFQLDAEYWPASEVGGDFYQVFERDGGLLAVAGDVSGKGLKAAMIVSLAAGILRAQRSSSPGAVLAALNDALAG